MRRRNFIALLSGAASWPLAARAQQAARVARVGYLVTGSVESPVYRPTIDAFRQGLSQLGYREGQNIVIEFREAHGQPERFAMLATELVRRDVDLIVAPNTPAARAARQATTTIPIVGFALGDAVEDGLVSSLARPGGNVTGLTFLAPELTAKRLQLLKDVLPTLSRVAALWHPGAFGERTTGEMLKTSEAAATALGLQLQMIATRSHEELDEAFSS
jgi:putative tryptophan/tyrosine transport system substrate-binding protein